MMELKRSRCDDEILSGVFRIIKKHVTVTNYFHGKVNSMNG